MLTELAQPVVVVCHDAGAANHIIEWFAREAVRCRPVMLGPATGAWRRRFPSTHILEDFKKALRGAKTLITGTGWSSSIEHDARAFGRREGAFVIAVVDHWTNYSERFERNGELVLPDEIWVTDCWALDLARKTFPNTVVREQCNAYLATAMSQVASLKGNESGTLFVLEPARSDWGRTLPGEFQALNYFMQMRGALGIGLEEPIYIRPHPSDPPGKYDNWLADHGDQNVYLDDSSTLFDSISRSTRVVGIQSYALVVADAVGRQAISALPPWAPALSLPQDGIIQLRSVVGGQV